MTSNPCFTAIYAVALIFTSPALMAEDKKIDMTVVGSGSDFKIEFLNSECKDENKEKGCIEAEKGNSPMLTWELDNIGETYWMLTRLQFSPDGEHWGDSAHPLADCTMKAFDLESQDRYSGNASSAMITGNGRKIRIKNHNEEECQTHYRIYAMPKAGGVEINSDPIIDNRGGGTR